MAAQSDKSNSCHSALSKENNQAIKKKTVLSTGNLLIRELQSLEEMLPHIALMQEAYPTLTEIEYHEMLVDMLPHNYGQVAVFDKENCIAISGYWLGTKLWCGKYLEMDNVIVNKNYRSQGVGNLICEFLERKAVLNNCNVQALDAYSGNFKAHRFYYNQGFNPLGFHFIKMMNEDKVR